MIPMIQRTVENYKRPFYYYDRARDAMYDAVNQLVEKGYNKILIPGFIGWSPKEGSGIFDPLNKIEGLNRQYYKMTEKLEINLEDIKTKMADDCIVLVVNYHGFRDKKIDEIISLAHDNGCVVIEDNAHGFFTYFCKGKTKADITFFSLHKMFPFEKGGSLLIENSALGIVPRENVSGTVEYNPFDYDINGIAAKRVDNYKVLSQLLEGKEAWFTSLRDESYLDVTIPQTFPIEIQIGNRDKIYDLMNGQGYGVVSLYHTMIEELRNDEHEAACRLSKKIMNLPVHQDVDTEEYAGMIEALIKACEATKG